MFLHRLKLAALALFLTISCAACPPGDSRSRSALDAPDLVP